MDSQIAVRHVAFKTWSIQSFLSHEKIQKKGDDCGKIFLGHPLFSIFILNQYQYIHQYRSTYAKGP